MTLSRSELDVRAVEDDYWEDPERAEATCEAMLAGPVPLPDSFKWRLRVLIARNLGRRGESEAAVKRSSQALRWAVEHHDTRVRVRAERALAMLFDQLGDAALALEHAMAANALIDDGESLLTQAEVRVCLADALAGAGSMTESSSYYDQADEFARAAGANGMLMLILNNRAYSEFAVGDKALAQRLADQLDADLAALGIEPSPFTRDTLAVIWEDAGRMTDVERVLSVYRQEPVPGFERDGMVAGLAQLSRIYRTRGDLDQAEQCIAQSREISASLPESTFAIDAERENAELLAARGQFQAAYESLLDYADRSDALRERERDMRARIVQATRHDLQMYRHLAERDSLTGLYNRRYVDQELAGIIDRAVLGGRSLLVSFVDLDFFKRINDTYSHQVGDEVLREIGRILEAVVAERPGSFAVRMGGEEFLVGVEGVTGAEAPAWLERLRARLENHDWTPLCGPLPVTASLGAVLAPADTTDRRELLSLADDRLYLAKARGRNCFVLTDPEPVTDRAALVPAAGVR